MLSLSLSLQTQYQHILHHLSRNGSWTRNRTGIDTQFIPAAMIQHDMKDGFPLMTLRQLYWRGGTAEAQGFLRGYDNCADFEKLGCNFWSDNANKPSKGSDTSEWLSSPHRRGLNDLGDIYGVQWRAWKTASGEVIDQIERALTLIHERPTDRRIVVTAWNPEAVVAQKAALPPCHDSFVIMIDHVARKMHLSWRQRSTDFILGTPTNLVSYGFILAAIARVTGYTAGMLTGHLDNVHLYENQLHAVEPLLSRKELTLPSLVFTSDVPQHLPTVAEQLQALIEIDNSHLTLVNYIHHEKIPDLNMAV